MLRGRGRGFEPENEPFFGCLRRVWPPIARRMLPFAAFAPFAVTSCATRAHIEPTSPTPAPAASATAIAPSPEEQVPVTAPEGAAPATADAGKPAGRCSAEGSALSRLCCHVAGALGARAAGAAVAVGPVASGAAPSRPAEMSTHIATCIARAVGGGARALASPLSFEQARAAAAPARALVFVAPEIARGRVQLKTTAYVVTPHGADRGGLAAIAMVEAGAALDGELGVHLPHIAVAANRIERIPAASDVVALACGDVTATGQTEIVVVSRHKVQVGRAGDGRFSVRAEVSWTSLSPVAPSPLREPIGGAAIVPGGGVLVGISDRAEGFLLSPALAKVRTLGAPVPLGGDFGCVGRSGIALGAPKPCEPRGKHLDDSSLIDAFASGTFVDAEGRAISVLSTRDATTHQVTLRQGTTATTLPVAGSALAVADLDLDGQPELVASADTDRAEDDAIVVDTWGRDGTIAERLRVPLKDGIRALAVCPVEDVRMAPIVAATSGGLWLVR